MITTILLMFFCFAIVYGALCDVTTYRIPNAVSYGLVGLFIPYALANFDNLPILLHVGTGVLVFVMCLVFWQLRWLGGGDVKFVGAIALWMGPDKILIFVILLAVASGIFIAILKF